MKSLKTKCFGTFLLALVVGVPGLPVLAQDKGTMQGMQHDNGPDMQAIHRMFANTDKIKRTVKKRSNGVETLTESSDPKVATMLQEHVQARNSLFFRSWEVIGYSTPWNRFQSQGVFEKFSGTFGRIAPIYQIT